MLLSGVGAAETEHRNTKGRRLRNNMMSTKRNAENASLREQESFHCHKIYSWVTKN